MPHNSRNYANSVMHVKQFKWHSPTAILSENSSDLVKGWFKTDFCMFAHDVYKWTVAVQVETSLAGFHLGMSHLTCEKIALTNPKWPSELGGERRKQQSRWGELQYFFLLRGCLPQIQVELGQAQATAQHAQQGTGSNTMANDMLLVPGSIFMLLSHYCHTSRQWSCQQQRLISLPVCSHWVEKGPKCDRELKRQKAKQKSKGLQEV